MQTMPEPSGSSSVASTNEPCNGPPATTPRHSRRSEAFSTRTSPASGPVTTGSPGLSVRPSTAPGPTRTPGPLTSLLAGPSTATRPPRSAPSSSKTFSTGPWPARTPAASADRHGRVLQAVRPARRRRRPRGTGPELQRRRRPHRPDLGRPRATTPSATASPAPSARSSPTSSSSPTRSPPSPARNGPSNGPSRPTPSTRQALVANEPGTATSSIPTRFGGLGKERPTSFTAATP